MKTRILTLVLLLWSMMANCNVVIAPSIFTDEVRIENDTKSIIEVSIFYIDGKEVFEAILEPGQKVNFDGSGLKPGYHFVRILQNGKVENRKMYKLS